MKRASTIFLQGVIVLAGAGVLFFLLRFPLYEGRNVDATLFQVYFNDPFLAYVYLASIAFFVAIYHAFRLLGYIGQNKAFTSDSVNALRIIRYCALVLVAFLLGSEAFFFIVQRKHEEDIAGGVMMGLILIFIAAIVATMAGVSEKTLQSAVDIKSENDLTV